MRFRFTSSITAFDCWKATMRHTYKSMAGLINIIFTGAMLALAIRFLGHVKPLETSLIILGLVWFPVIIPIATYFRHKSSLKNFPKGMELMFNDQGMHVVLGGKQEDIPWKKLKRIAIEPEMVILYSDAAHGYMLSNKNMGSERDKFISYIQTKAG